VRAGAPQREDRQDTRTSSDRWEEARAEHRWREACRTYDSARFRAPVLEPLARAWISGLYCFWVLESPRWRQRECVLVPRPTLHTHAGRLHCGDGPAVEWRNGLSYWFWEGLHVPRRVAARGSERARLQVLVRTRNLELRRLLLDRIGYERFLDIADASLIQQDDYGRLWRTGLSVDQEPMSVVEVVNSTPEADGTYRRYFLRVPPHARTCGVKKIDSPGEGSTETGLLVIAAEPVQTAPRADVFALPAPVRSRSGACPRRP
jgi:hypothetical protein